MFLYSVVFVDVCLKHGLYLKYVLVCLLSGLLFPVFLAPVFLQRRGLAWNLPAAFVLKARALVHVRARAKVKAEAQVKANFRLEVFWVSEENPFGNTLGESDILRLT